MTYLVGGILITLVVIAGVIWFIIEATKQIIPAAFAAYPPYPPSNISPAYYRIPRPLG